MDIEAFNKLYSLLEIKDNQGRYKYNRTEIADYFNITAQAVTASRAANKEPVKQNRLDKLYAYEKAYKKLPELLKKII